MARDARSTEMDWSMYHLAITIGVSGRCDVIRWR